MTTPLRAALYARVSTSEQDPAFQLDELHQVARARGWTVVETTVDRAVSGARRDRPGLDRVLELARGGRIDLVAVWSLDRLGRSLVHLLTLLEDLQAAGVGFVAVRQAGLDTTGPAGRLLVQLLGAFAEFERELIRERVVAGVRRAQGRGIHCGRPAVSVTLEELLQAERDLGSTARAAAHLGIGRATAYRLKRGGVGALAEPRGGADRSVSDRSARNHQVSR